MLPRIYRIVIATRPSRPAGGPPFTRLMYRVAFSLLRNAQDAEDAVQEAFLKLYRGDAMAADGERKGVSCPRTVWRVALDRLPKGHMRQGQGQSLDETMPVRVCQFGDAFARRQGAMRSSEAARLQEHDRRAARGSAPGAGA